MSDPLAILTEYVERSTHWRSGGVDRHDVKLALKELTRQQTAAKDEVLSEIIGCFDAAIAEGLFEAIDTTTDDRLKDLLDRRIMHAYFAAIGPSK